MAGKIFVLRENNELSELTPSQYSNEDFFQGLIEKHPEILAGDQINPDNPRRWLLISREMGVPAEQDGGTQWYLDHLFIDQDGIPTLVEVKRSTDTRLRREVVAQMLDYAANAVQHWPIELICDTYAKNISETNSLSSLGIDPENEEAFWQSVSVNLRAGRIRLIFAADVIPASLQTIIEFLNKQMVDTEVLGLEIKQFLSTDGLTTLVPHILGKTASSGQVKRSNTRQWDEESFIEQAIELSGDEIADVCKKLLRTFESLGGRIWWGQGAGSSFAIMYDKSKSHYLFYVYNGSRQTHLQVYFKEMKPGLDTDEQKIKLKNALEKIPGVQIPNDRLSKYPSFPVKTLIAQSNFDLFVSAMQMYIDDINLLDSTNG